VSTAVKSSKESAAKVLEVKQQLMLLFLNYCEFNLKNETYITHSCFLRICRDANVAVPENSISIMMSSTLKTKANLIKAINF